MIFCQKKKKRERKEQIYNSANILCMQYSDLVLIHQQLWCISIFHLPIGWIKLKAIMKEIFFSPHNKRKYIFQEGQCIMCSWKPTPAARASPVPPHQVMSPHPSCSEFGSLESGLGEAPQGGSKQRRGLPLSNQL